MNILTTLTNEEKDRYVTLLDYYHNQIIFNEGDLCDEISIVVFGEIAIVSPTFGEKEEIINIVSDNEIFGNNLVFASNPYYLGTCIARKNTLLALINKKNLLDLFQNNATFLQAYLQNNSDDTLKIKQQCKLLAHKNIRDRIMYYLNEQKKTSKSNIIPLRSVTHLASLLSLPRPSVARELRHLIDEGLIKYNTKRITLLI